MKVKEIANLIENVAPVCYASPWDNVGLNIGDLNAEVNKVMLTLDVTPSVVAQAIEENCELIISHHPFIFDELKSIDFNTPMGNMINLLVSNKMSVYSCHTNMDSADGGINTNLARMFGLDNVVVLERNEKYENVGIGRVGKLKKSITAEELVNETKTLLNTPFVRVVSNNLKDEIECLAVASGSCGDLIALAKEKGADAIITADVKYHQALEALDIGICVIDAGHFPTENHVTDILKNLLQNTGLEIVLAKTKDCFQVI